MGTRPTPKIRSNGRAQRPLAVAEIAAELDLKKPTVYRLVSALVEEQRGRRDPH